MFELKPLHKDGIEGALAKAERYRLLNEPGEAESICLDVLAVDPHNQTALISLLLALTDQFEERAGAYQRARDVVRDLTGEYDRAYYAGLIEERRAKAQCGPRAAGLHAGAYERLRDAMDHFARAEQLRPAGNDDARLRWNACVRFLRQHPELAPQAAEREVDMLE
jgi:tetratricopeptide (TPR) repeat protein